MIATAEEIDLVLREKRPRRQMWLPVTRGTHGERQACPFEIGQCVPLQPKRGVKGVKITVVSFTLTSLATMTDADATQQGYVGGVRGARDAWERLYGPWRGDCEVWAIRFNLGDHSKIYADHQERFLKAKLGGARDYTHDPSKAVRGEGAVPDADLAPMAARAALQRRQAAESQLRSTLRTIEASIREMEPHEGELARDIKKDLRWLRRRARQIRQALGEPVAA